MDYKVEEIGKEFFLIRSPEKELNRNIYLKRFISEDRKEKVNMIFDPGTSLDYQNLFKILKDLIGGVKNIHLIFLSHQDPDVSSNIRTFLTASPKAILISSIDTFRLVSMYGVPEKNFKAVESFKKDILKISKTGHFIQFVPAYFCHFRGAMMFYDFESRVLFSGDFLAGINTRKGEGVYANEDSWKGISIFHQIYMPTKQALLLTINRIGLLNPLPEVIAPQHGDVIKGDLVFDFMTRLSKLDVGVDLLSWTENERENLILAFNDFLNSLKEMEEEKFKTLLERLRRRGEFTTAINFVGDYIKEIKLFPQDAVSFIMDILEREIEGGNELSSLLINSLNKYGVSLKLPGISSSEGSLDTLME